jgi:hypothetical protein
MCIKKWKINATNGIIRNEILLEFEIERVKSLRDHFLPMA